MSPIFEDRKDEVVESKKEDTHREKSLIKPDKRGNIPGMDQDAWIIVVFELGVSSLPHSC
ncbi:hypothetical protein J6590_047177 [Homalodisca vitripennis]|nr:hypothetical protein J6590_047177 [Homalodisca vitripennis]